PSVAPAPAAAASPSPATSAASSPPAAESKPQDILYQLTSRPNTIQSFTPLHAQRRFWLAQLVPLIVLAGLSAWRIRKARLDNREARRIAALHAEAAELMRNLRREDASPRDYFSQASRAVQIKTALAKNVDPNAVDAETAATTFRLDEHSRAQLQSLFARSDEARYSGAANGGVSKEDKQEILRLLESLRS